MRINRLQNVDLLLGYEAVIALYPNVPSLIHWRAWEYSVYKKFKLLGTILDLGCGDGRFFKLIWPHASDVVGVDMDSSVGELALQSGVYRKVHVTKAHRIPEGDCSFDHVFANCSMEHMDHLDAVLAEIFRCLKPGGSLLCSVVTDRFIKWSLLPILVAQAGFAEAAAALQKDFIDYHHLVNPLSVEEWCKCFARAGLVPEEHFPILPKHNSGIFLLIDSLWHLKRVGGGEMGDMILPFLSSSANFPGTFRKILSALLEMETDWYDCSGAVFFVRKPR